MEPPNILSGWKDIANYLRKGVRTVQRYERMIGLPVRRPAGKPRGSVVATRTEIDAWVAASPVGNATEIRPAKDSRHSASIEEMRRNIAEMRRLREEMAGLQVQISFSVQVLAENVNGVRGQVGLGPYPRLGVIPLLKPDQFIEETSLNLLGLLGENREPQKVLDAKPAQPGAFPKVA